MATEAESSIFALQRFQAIVAMTSELDLSVLHPPMAEKTPLPLHNIIQWDPERLKRVARWRESGESGKDTVRAYAKVVLALRELESSSQIIPMHAGCAAAVPPTNLPSPLSEAPGEVPTTVVLKSALKARRTEKPAAAGARFGRLIPWKPPARYTGKLTLPSPPPILLETLRTWHTACSVLLQTLLFALQWTPVIGLLIFICVCLSDPLLLLRLMYTGVRSVPIAIRGMLDGQDLPAMAVPAQPLFPYPQPPLVPAAPSLSEVCVDKVSWTEWFSVLLLASEGGGAAVWLAHVRGWR